jgi:hypothetical protein
VYHALRRVERSARYIPARRTAFSLCAGEPFTPYACGLCPRCARVVGSTDAAAQPEE